MNKDKIKDLVYSVLNGCLLDLNNYEDLSDKEYCLLQESLQCINEKLQDAIDDEFEDE